jgi:hypothetical protein
MARAGGVRGDMEYDVAMATLAPRREEVLRWAYGRMTSGCAQRGIAAFATIIPIPAESAPEAKLDEQREEYLAREGGFTVIGMLDVYDSLPALDGIWVAPWDQHPNANGHVMLADRLYAGLVRELGLDR